MKRPDTFLGILSLCATLLSGAALAQTPDAANYPSRPIKLVVGYPPGGTTDLLARLLGEQIATRLGQPVVVENRAGASGMIGTDHVAKSPADGYTLLFSASTLATYKSLYPNVPFDPVKDFEPVALLATTPYVIVKHESLPVTTVGELVSYAHAKPGSISYAASVPGSGQHLTAELLKQKTHADMVYVPYKGSAGVLPDLLSGRIQMAVDNIAVVTQYVNNGTIKALAVTGSTPSPLLPGVPTVASEIPGFNVLGWFAVFAPAATPRPVVAKVAQAIGDMVADEAVRKRMLEFGAEPASGGPDALRDRLDSEITMWSKVIQDAHIKLQ